MEGASLGNQVQVLVLNAVHPNLNCGQSVLTGLGKGLLLILLPVLLCIVISQVIQNF